MARTVVWTESAYRDLEDIADFIAKDSRLYAAAFVEEARDSARTLKEFAERGRIVPEFESQNLRELFVKSYRLIYRITEDGIAILALVHGARDLAALWKMR